MKVAEITTYKEGGIYTHVAELADRIHAETLLITGNSSKSGYGEENGKRFFHVPCLFSFWEIYFINPPGSSRKVHQVIQDNDIQLIHMHGPLFSFGGSLYRKSSVPVVITTHYVIDFKGNRVVSAIYKIIIRWVTKQMARYAKKIICVNEQYPAIYTSWGIDPQKIVYIPNGIDTKKFSPGKSDIKQKLGCHHLIVYWGRLGYQKNIAVLIQAFKQVKTSDVKLAIIGKGPDLPKLQLLARPDDRIIFPGYLSDDDLVRYARGADLAVLPSRGESWGLVIGEAMGCGLPVISSNVGMAHELLGDHRGILLKNDTPEELTSCIEYCLSHKIEAKMMGQHARTFIVDRYSWEEVAKKIDALYQSCLNGKYTD
jgi:glycosyltransferase involved in cell wall biosynthesis